MGEFVSLFTDREGPIMFENLYTAKKIGGNSEDTDGDRRKRRVPLLLLLAHIFFPGAPSFICFPKPKQLEEVNLKT